MSKTITRKYIQRITKREGNTSIRQSGGGGGGGGGASQYWVEENYISKLFFNQLFTVYDEDGNVVEPNDTESVIASIKSMFGFWTDAYLSALGNGEGGGAELTLASLADVDVHGVANGQALVYDATTQKWVPGQGGGIDITAMWAALAQSGVQQIDVSHLATALTGYATETWVGNQGYITGSALNGYATESWVGSQISDMATQTWVSGNYLSQTNAAATYLTQTNAAATYLTQTNAAATYLTQTAAANTYLTKSDAATTYVSIAFFERLFKAYNGSTVIHPNNTTSTIDNIKAMFGFWTDFYLSALGNGSGGSTPGVTMAQVWSALGNSTTEQINISHLTTALASYNPTNNFKTINGYSIIGTGDLDISGGSGNYLPLTGGTLTGPLNIQFNSYAVNIQSTNSAFSGIGINIGTTLKGEFAYRTHTYGMYMYNHNYRGMLGLQDDGTPYVGKYGKTLYTLLHSGNYSTFLDSYATQVKVNGSVYTCVNGLIDLGNISGSTGNYLPLTGGTLTGQLNIQSNNYGVNIQSTNSSVSGIGINVGTTLKGEFAYRTPTYGMYMYNHNYRGMLGLQDDGTPYVGKYGETLYTLIHSGNFSMFSIATTSDNVASATKLQNSRNIWGQYFDGTSDVDSTLHLYGTVGTGSGGYNEGIRLHQFNNGWVTIALCGSDNTGTSGTSANTWTIHKAQSNDFYINRNASASHTGYELCNVNGNWGIATVSPLYKLDVNGEMRINGAAHITNIGIGFNRDITSGYIYDTSKNGFQINYSDNYSGIQFGVVVSNSYYPKMLLANNGNLGIDTMSPSSKLHVNGTFYTSGNSSIGGTLGVVGTATLSSNLTVAGNVGIGTTSPTYKLHISGVAYASTGFYSGGYVTALSDARHKDVKGDVGLTVREVANAPAVKFLWKDRRQEGLKVGSIAQYWQKVMPEAIVKNADGELTMSYGVIALLASIATARKVENHERRIRELEEENKKLKQQLNAA